VVETTTAMALRAVRKAGRVADLVELRLDYLKQAEWEPLLVNRPKPVIVTQRRSGEGGGSREEDEKRICILKEAVVLGADYVDVEMRSRRSLILDLIENRKKTEVILSFHDFRGTASHKELRRLFERMILLGGDVVKIVTFARSWEDNAKPLLLIPYALKRKKRIVAFCMGEKGKMSRLFSPLMGAAWTYASLAADRASAPGQLTAGQMKDIWKRLR